MLCDAGMAGQSRCAAVIDDEANDGFGLCFFPQGCGLYFNFLAQRAGLLLIKVGVLTSTLHQQLSVVKGL